MIKSILFIVFICSACSIYTTSPAATEDLPLVEIGHHLFFDKRLSFNNTKSCASCHDPELAFTDGYRRSLGATADLHMRNAPTLINVADNKYFTAADPRITTLRQQIRGPLFNSEVIELGVTGNEERILQRLQKEKIYRNITWDLILDALTAYVSKLRSYNSKYDQCIQNKDRICFTDQEKRGKELFFSERLGCAGCHGGMNFNTPKAPQNQYVKNSSFILSNTHVNTKFEKDLGLNLVTKKPEDIGKFRIPTLRNVTLTAPYMHDGSINTLKEVLMSHKSSAQTPSSLSENEVIDLIQFLETLKDTSYLKDKFFIE